MRSACCSTAAASAQLKTIASELNKALEGREGNARSVLTQIETFTGQLDENKGDIVDAIESLNRLAVARTSSSGTIDAALDELPERAGVAWTGSARPGQDAQGAGPARRRRHPGDPGVQDRDDRRR